MSISPDPPGLDDLDLVCQGPSHKLSERLGLANSSGPFRLKKILLLMLVTWLPLLLLSAWAGRAVRGKGGVPFLQDPEINAKLLVVIPFLEVSALIVPASLAAQARRFATTGLIPEQSLPRFRTICSQSTAARKSAIPEILLVILAFMLSGLTRLVFQYGAGDPSWERVASMLTPAGWWNMLVSLPVLYFLILRWQWVFLLWTWFLFQTSRIELKLTATHPDHAGGLGFVGSCLTSFGFVLMGVSTVFSAGFADEILNRGRSLDDLKFHVVAFVVAALVLLHLPLLPFLGQLARCRFRGLMEFGALVFRYDRELDKKWLESPAEPTANELLGSADFQTMADIATCYEHVHDMRMIPFDVKAVTVLVIAAFLPMVPLVLTAIPMSEIFSKLVELVF